MTTQKLIKYDLLDFNGIKLKQNQNLKLSINLTKGNYLLHRDLLRHNINQKQKTVSTKTRAEVRGGGRKPWRQKGTGRARAGSIRSPLWKGGGVIFGPKPKNFIFKLNKKERQLAIQTLLYNKNNKFLIIKDLEINFIISKTKAFLKICQNYKINNYKKILLILSKKTIPLKLATQNLQNIKIILASNLNTFSLLKADQILISSSGFNILKEIYCE